MLKNFRKTAAQILIAGLAFTGATMAQAQGISGVWNMHDGSSASDKIVGQIKLDDKAGAVTGTWIKYMEAGKPTVCEDAPEGDARKGKPLAGLPVLTDLKGADGKYEGGSLLQCDKGRLLKIAGETKEGGKQLEMKIKVGFITATRMWTKAN